MQEDAAARSPIWLEVLKVDVETRLAMLASSSRYFTRLMWSSGTSSMCAHENISSWSRVAVPHVESH